MEKLANTRENKAKFLLHCYAENKDSIKSYQGSGVVFGILDIINNPEHYYAELTPLSQITDEDAIEVAKCLGLKRNLDIKRYSGYIFIYEDGNSVDIWFPICEINTTVEGMDIEYYFAYQYLQSKGYALPWIGLSVDDLISYGGIVLKED